MGIRVVLADGQDLVREGVALLLQRAGGVEVVGQGRDGREAVRLACDLRPDVVVIDDRLGVALSRLLACDGHRVLVLGSAGASVVPPGGAALYGGGGEVGDDVAVSVLRAGAFGFLLKARAGADLAAAVARVAAGGLWLDPAAVPGVVRELRSMPEAAVGAGQRLGRLTPRETEVLALVAQGLSNHEVAERLVVGVPTVKTHVGRVLAKLAVRDRAQAVAMAYQTRLVRVARLG